MKCLLLHQSEPRYDDLLSEHDIKITKLPVLQTTILDVVCCDETRAENYQGIIVSSKHGVSYIVNNKIDISG